MEYREIAPPPALAQFAEAVWWIEGSGNPDQFQPVLPDGRSELVLHRSARFTTRNADDTLVRQPSALFVGQLERGLLLASEGAVSTIGVRWHPHGAALVLGGVPPPLTVGQQLAFASLEQRWLSAACREALEAETIELAVSRLVAALERRAAAVSPPDPRVTAGVSAVLRSHGAVSVSQLAERLNLSARQLERRFLETVGLPPKRLARTIRFQRAVSLLATVETTRCAEVAHAAGYFDQAHFVRDCREFSGAPPSLLAGEGLAAFTELFVRR